MKRADAEAMVKKTGGSCKSSVTKDLSYLVTNDTSSGSSKNVKAAKYGVAIIDEDEFFKVTGISFIVLLILLTIGFYYREDIKEMKSKM